MVCLAVQAKIGSIDVLSVVDSGLRMLTRPELVFWAMAAFANGFETLHLGYLELDVEVDWAIVPRSEALVLKDTPNTAKQIPEVPGPLGAHVLAQFQIC